jgi:hypothetical protein
VHVNSLEKAVDFDAVEKEAQLLVTELTVSNPNDRVEKMMQDAEAFKNGQLSALSYYSGLLLQTRKSYPTLTNYVSYLRAADGIDADRLFDEVTQAEEQIAHQLIRHPLAQQLYDHLRWMERAEKFFSLNLIPQEWAQEKSTTADSVQARLSSIRSFINEQQMDLGYRFTQPVISPVDLSRAVNGASAFYNAASSRNAVMVSNLERVLKDNPADQSLVVFITGGFHTPNMTKLLRAKGLAYEVFRPQLETEVQLSNNLNMRPRKVDYLRNPGGLTQPAVVNAAKIGAKTDELPAELDIQNKGASKNGVGYVPASEALPKMLEDAAALAGVSVADLKDEATLQRVVDLYNTEVGGLKDVIQGRPLEQTGYTPLEISQDITAQDKQEFLASVAKGERLWMISAAGRATRMQLPAKFDDLGAGG